MINNVLKKGADDLDDDFVYDESLVEVSGEDDFEGQIDFNDEDDELKNNNLKRKLDDGEKHSNQSSLTKNEKQRLRKKQKKLLKEPVKYDFCVPQKKSDILSEYWKKFKILKKNKYKLSALELEDLEVQKWDEELFVDTSEICFERNTLNIWNGICHALPSISSKKAVVESPKVLVLCASALRCIEIIDVLKKNTKSRIVKLFAKHLKVDEQINVLKLHEYLIGVGTPNRVDKIMKEHADFLKATELVLIDASFVDKKKRTILTLNECNMDLFQFIHNVSLYFKNNNNNVIKVMFF